MTAGVERKRLGSPPHKSNAAPVSDAHEKVQIQDERLGTGKDPTTAAVLIREVCAAASSASSDDQTYS